MLPFSIPEFFLVALFMIAVIWCGKWFLYRWISYTSLLLAITLIFIGVFFPKPVHLTLFVLYSYCSYYLLVTRFSALDKLWGIVILCLPMILVKLEIREGAFNLNNIISIAGLSYMTFRTVSLYYDHRKQDSPVDLKDYFCYLTFIPTLLIGPIDRFNRFNKDLGGGYQQLALSRFMEGATSLLYGIFYSYVCAEIIDRYWLSELSIESTRLTSMLGNMYGYFFYLFFDFAGYSSMAIGIGKMLGVDVPINFDRPFLARNPQDFWRRFHKSLGEWLSDYFFKPLYKWLSKKKRLKKHPITRQNIALFSTFTLMGCWNGFYFNFILSGMIFGLYSVVYNTYLVRSKKAKKDLFFHELSPKLVTAISIFIMFHLGAFSIYIFSGRFPFI